MGVLLIALRMLCLLKFTVQRHLQAGGEKLAGLYPGNPKWATARPDPRQSLAVDPHDAPSIWPGSDSVTAGQWWSCTSVLLPLALSLSV